jgi:hypothetical protein
MPGPHPWETVAMLPYPGSSFPWVSLPTWPIASLSAELAKIFIKIVKASGEFALKTGAETPGSPFHPLFDPKCRIRRRVLRTPRVQMPVPVGAWTIETISPDLEGNPRLRALMRTCQEFLNSSHVYGQTRKRTSVRRIRGSAKGSVQ